MLSYGGWTAGSRRRNPAGQYNVMMSMWKISMFLGNRKPFQGEIGGISGHLFVLRQVGDTILSVWPDCDLMIMIWLPGTGAAASPRWSWARWCAPSAGRPRRWSCRSWSARLTRTATGPSASMSLSGSWQSMYFDLTDSFKVKVLNTLERSLKKVKA